MEEAERTNGSASGTPEHHLCVLVHGLWGNPAHLDYVAASLRAAHPGPGLRILVAARNAGSFTYDGVELGGERVTQEIEEALDGFERDGTAIGKLSVVGYSLGGLVARYAIGLLFSRGWFEKIQPVNFTTFATPHLGVRTPSLGLHNTLWNALGARTLSMSGRQLFTIDDFRGSGRPLLSVMADPDSIFVRALAAFRKRSLYANIVNDRTAVFYTTSISSSDPFVDLDAVKVHYVPGYEDVIVDGSHPVSPLAVSDEAPTLPRRILKAGATLVTRAPTVAALVLLLPIGAVAFLLNSAVQSVRSSQRIRLHEAGKAGVGIASYRIPLMVEDVQSAVEGVLEDLNHGGQEAEYLPASSSSSSRSTAKPEKQTPRLPTLALSDAQFAMIRALDAVGFRKYPVHIHNDRHSHAAMIVRRKNRPSFDEGKVVMRFWLERDFEI
ncbi:MAG: hypothetical protein M1832_001502 [Thelocarpon impressellum]|nr:MAG: hypothetical protein M1832_001502 [Thelocarpon impressellum]